MRRNFLRRNGLGRMAVLAALFLSVMLPATVLAQGEDADLAEFEAYINAMMKPSTGKVVSQYDLTAAPADIAADDITAKLINVKNSLFFLGSFIFSGKVNVDADSFLIPNGDYAKMDFTWKTLKSQSGASIFRDPTAAEKENDARFRSARSAIYVTDEDAKPGYAEGTVHFSIPCKFARAKMTVNELNAPRQLDKCTVALQRCENDVATVSLRGMPEDEVENMIFIYRDATGGALKTRARMSREDGDKLLIIAKAQGTVTAVDVYYPTEYANCTLDLIATAEPESFGVDTIDVLAPRYVQAGPPVTPSVMTLATLKSQTSAVARRSYAMMGYNTPEVAVKLPRVINSAFANVNFGTPKLLNTKNLPVAYEPELGGFDYDSFTNEIRFANKHGETPLAFARAVGTVQIQYPATLKFIKLTPEQPSYGNMVATFSGAKVKIQALPKNVPSSAFSVPEYLAPVCVYDASGRQLKKLGYSGSGFNGNVTWQEFAFWGEPTEVRLIMVGSWLSYSLPFNLPPSAKLPEDAAGEKPANYE